VKELRMEPVQRDDEAIGRFIERFAGILAESGMPRMAARVFVAMLSSDAPALSAAELAALLGVSPAAVSGAVRYLVQVGLASGVGEPGSRRLSYSVPPDIWQHMLRTRNATMARWAEILRDGADLLGVESAGGERIAQSARYFDFVAAVLPGVLDRWDEYKAGPERPA
jgi:DNA-binding transcriptional regulator GbsR (MarR family)